MILDTPKFTQGVPLARVDDHVIIDKMNDEIENGKESGNVC